MENPLVSIIVPVYNVEKYLRKCLDSIINQTYQNIEIILVDDGSKDTSGQICDEYGEKDIRIKAFHQINSGPGAARNKGIKQARGKYITFVDSDDWIENNYAEIIVNEMSTDLLYFGMRALKKNGEIYDYILPKVSDDLSIEDNIYSMLLKMNSVFDFVMTANKCFKRDIIEKYGIEFPADVLHSEDEIFTLRYFLHIRSLKCISNILYYYNQRDSSASIHISHNELFRICDYQYKISEMFISNKMRSFMKVRWAFFNYRNYCFNYKDSGLIIRNFKQYLNASDINAISMMYNTQINNKNVFPNKSFIIFVQDFLMLFSHSLMYLYSDLYIKLRRRWLFFKDSFKMLIKSE